MKKFISILLTIIFCISITSAVFADSDQFFYYNTGYKRAFSDCDNGQLIGVYKDISQYPATSQYTAQMSHLVLYNDGTYELTFSSAQLILLLKNTYTMVDDTITLASDQSSLGSEFVLKLQDDGTIKYTSSSIYGCLSPSQNDTFVLVYGNGFEPKAEPTPVPTAEPTAEPVVTEEPVITPAPTDAPEEAVPTAEPVVTPEPTPVPTEVPYVTAPPITEPTSKPAPTAAPDALQTGVNVYVNGKAVTFDQPPVIINDRTMVPVRGVFEALGATVTWDDSIKTAYGVLGDTTVSIKIGEKAIYKNSVAIAIDTEAQIVNSRTLVPVRAIAEAFNCTVDWDSDTRTVIITSY